MQDLVLEKGTPVALKHYPHITGSVYDTGDHAVFARWSHPIPSDVPHEGNVVLEQYVVIDGEDVPFFVVQQVRRLMRTLLAENVDLYDEDDQPNMTRLAEEAAGYFDLSYASGRVPTKVPDWVHEVALDVIAFGER